MQEGLDAEGYNREGYNIWGYSRYHLGRTLTDAARGTWRASHNDSITNTRTQHTTAILDMAPTHTSCLEWGWQDQHPTTLSRTFMSTMR